jgi:hypothetical protein
MPDYADWTESIELLGTEIQVPIDIQGAFIQVPIDIQGQYVDLTVDIVAQTVGNIAIDIAAQTIGNISVNIAASAVTLNINIAAQAANVTIEINAQTVAVKLQPDWSSQQGQHKFFRVSGSNIATGVSAAANYTVTAGKTLFITHFGGSMYGTAAADRDKDQICYMNIMNNTTATILAELGGHGGGGMVLPTPVKIPAGEVFRYQTWNFSNHNCEVYLTAGGYEI